MTQREEWSEARQDEANRVVKMILEGGLDPGWSQFATALNHLVIGIRLHESDPEFCERLYDALTFPEGREELIRQADQMIAMWREKIERVP